VHLLAAFALMGVGLGAASVASTHVGTTAADPAYQGVASGVLGSAAQIGTALGLAVVAPLASSSGSAGMAAYRAGFLGTCVLAAGGLAAGLLMRSRDRDPLVDAPG
jgi:MFS family permease